MIDMVGFGVSGVGGGAAFPLSANLVGSWNLFGGDATQTDNSGNGNDLSPNNSPGQATGPDGVNCADLESSSGQRYGITHASQTGLSPGSGDFAGAIFYNPESLSSDHFICGKYKNSANGEWYLFYDFSLNRFKFVVITSAGAVQVAPASLTPSVGSFSFIKWYIDTTAQEMALGLDDGSFITTALTAAVVSSTEPFTVGERAFSGSNFVDGRVAILHIWNAVPTAAEWTDLWNSGSGLRYNP